MGIESVKDRHKDALRALANVVGLGIGPKVRGGRATGETAIKVFVSQKVPPESLPEDQRIPANIEGIPADVEVLGSLKAR
ncbi:MAG: hypothetical protein ACYSUQ_01505 [Planctomycetota bacterium]|jgi:hypothetical protein